MNRNDSDLKTPSARRTTFPTVLTSFVGRQHDMAEVRRLLVSSRLLTLTGAAGCGKTRLALRVATEVNRHYADGVHWVELARLADGALVPQGVAKVLHVAEQHGRSTVERLLDALQDQQLLLVLDNCEHLLSACTQLVEPLLAATEVRILATSRERLGVSGEMCYPVPPMALPPLPLPVDAMDQFDAIQLVVERARAILPDFALTPDNGLVWPRIEPLLCNIVEVEPAYTVEGDALLPQGVASLMDGYGKEIRACFIGYAATTPAQKMTEIRAFGGDVNDWLQDHPNQYILDLCQEMIEFSSFVQKECAARGIPYFDVSVDFMVSLEKAYSMLCDHQ